MQHIIRHHIVQDSPEHLASLGLTSINAIQIRRDLNGWIENELASHHTFVTVLLGGGVYCKPQTSKVAETSAESSTESSTERSAEACTESPLRRLRGSINVRARLKLFECCGVVSGAEAQRLRTARTVLAELGSEDGWWRGLTARMLSEGAWDARGMRVGV